MVPAIERTPQFEETTHMFKNLFLFRGRKSHIYIDCVCLKD
jgi:hypothetical protein